MADVPGEDVLARRGLETTVTEHEGHEGVAAEPVGEVPAGSEVASALGELDTLGERDLAEHPEVFERIHGHLDAALRAIDDA